ncbi:MAG: recombinase family protein [Actinomycetota bacterium]|jgi:DNA invertase Pin-like site-specific DNA recombinase|nr:recombinase family protein [Acidobacteriota bacterium]MCL6094052.1 recombinase family protein [Actinomycetota bacterium]MDA8167106.1 recombinase family protein [Actinomycetota bacterium]
MRCVIYLRVSTREQAEGGFSIPAQREACLKLIKEKDWSLVDEYADRGESARSTARPQLQEMLSRVTQKDVDAVIVHKIDRLARNMEDHVAIKAVLTRSGAQLVSVVENIEDSASGRFVEGIHALMAEFYSANLSSEVKKGLLQKAKSGGMVTRAPVGYKNVRDTIEGKSIARVILDEDMAPLVKECFELYSSGNYSLAEIQRLMAKKGLKNNFSKKRPYPEFCKSSIASLLQNKFYMGVVTYRNVEYPGLHEALVEPSLFNRVQQTLRSRDQAGERKRKHPHYLKGSIYCAECGSRLSYLIAKGTYAYFYCLGQKRHNGYSQKYLDAIEVEKKVEKLYKDIQLPPATVKKLKKQLEEDIVISRRHQSYKERD